MTVHIKQLTGKMHVRGWISGRSLTACTKFYCNNVLLQLRLEIYFSKLVEMSKICPCCKYVSNLYQTITFTWLLRINTYLANICICPHFSRQRKCNANLELQIYHIFAPFANISKSVFSSSEGSHLEWTASPCILKLIIALIILAL